MNLELLESFGQNYPEEFDGSLDSISLAATCAFNRRGTLLAVGCNDGRIFIWDFLTRGIAKSLSAHLLSASTDHNVCIWDVLSGECEQRYRFPTPILRVQFDPRNNKRFLVCPMRHAALLGDINVIASFDRRGDTVYTGNAKGKILILDSQTLSIKASFKITVGTSSTTSIKSIEFARRGEPRHKSLRHKYCTEVWREWRAGAHTETTGSGKQYICAGSARQHALYVWEKSIGNLVKILHGTKGELLLDVVWHPIRPIIASISAAFAPDFKELDENVEYEERESEFDVEDEDRSVDPAGESLHDEEPVAAFCSSDEEGEDENMLSFLPIAPEIEDPEDGWAATQETVTPTETPEKLEPTAKRVKSKTYDITLKIAPPEQTISFGGKNKQAAGNKKVAGRPRK
ncbi:Retinoblastoma-binding protein 5 [Operophtera brumata]|uniref:Retinoblastoma-binding protein 5 n=1 Tax=Operophtera brumata TaxID=104452 RepID=A0A0L7LK44_OPEBR|nr:Retinoblastoma-binding protein 5 [Operophtera brumata]